MRRIDGLVFIFTAAAAIVALSEWKTVRAQAVERGYAVYCPETGDFAWEGECGE